MAKHKRRYQSPYAPLMTDQRFEFASQLAKQYRMDVSEVLMAYMQITASVAKAVSGTQKRQQEIDQRFTAFLTDAQKLPY
ncbi:hypothetical protein [Levilactobacillus bambusae]|uniref:Uncharacterized protein n=1 Tax=Levilactobacillus bambusae TaxID=2024736 RepID=A0A2V1MZZ6_9LACO|nr:hypothetical protein [Levilactobacillus bambusae]PWG00068.1 hypothetical protein DCM90_03780 [Levilactobacillus bambusae]